MEGSTSMSEEGSGAPESTGAKSLHGVLMGGAALLFAAGFVARVLPLLDRGGRLLNQYPTEDGYLLLTIARNIALGKGMSVADGTIATNGTQPLATFLWSGVFAMVGADRKLGVGLVLAAETMIAVLTALLVLRLGEALLGRHANGRAFARLGSALWFASPVAIPHTMNCLESGVYVATVVASVLFYVRARDRSGPFSARTVLGLGGILGLAFWARNDAVFLGAAVAAVHCLGRPAVSRVRSFAEIAGVGATAALLGSPWLLNNFLRFGHLVPISGRSESLFVAVGDNLPLVAIPLAEQLSVIVPLPNSWEDSLVVRVGAALFFTLTVPLALSVWRSTNDLGRRMIAVAGVYLLLLSGYYGLLFGASHFLARYFFPTSPFFALLWMAGLRAPLARLRPALRVPVSVAGVAVALLIVVGVAARDYRAGAIHEHSQVIRWVDENVPETSWVGAAQSGTLGFFHARTINLDGKVNPEALAAREERRIPEYALSKGIEFIVDWADFAGWMERPAFRQHMELLVHDPRANLAVLRRKGALTLPERQRSGKDGASERAESGKEER